VRVLRYLFFPLSPNRLFPVADSALRFHAPQQASLAGTMSALSVGSEDGPFTTEGGRTVVVLVTSMPATTVISGNQVWLMAPPPQVCS